MAGAAEVRSAVRGVTTCGGGYLYSWLAQSCSPPGLLITTHCSSAAPSQPPAAAAAAAAVVVHKKSLA